VARVSQPRPSGVLFAAAIFDRGTDACHKRSVQRVLTCASSWLSIGIWNDVINFSVAAAKVAIVAFVFMHLGKSGAIRASVSVALFVLTLIFALGGSDYATRDLHPAAWQAPVGQNS